MTEIESSVAGTTTLDREWQSTCRHVALIGVIIRVPSQLVCTYSFNAVYLPKKQHNTNFLFFDVTRPRLEPTIYCSRNEYANHYTTDVVLYIYWRLNRKKKIMTEIYIKIQLHLLYYMWAKSKFNTIVFFIYTILIYMYTTHFKYIK